MSDKSFPSFPMNALLESIMSKEIKSECGKTIKVTIEESLANAELLKVLEIYKVWIKRMGRGLVTVRELTKDRKMFDPDSKHLYDMVMKITDKVYLESELKDVLDDGTKLSCEEEGEQDG